MCALCAWQVVVNNCGGCQPTYYAYPAYGYYDPYGYAYYPYGYYGGYYAPGYYYTTPVYYYAEAPAPALSGTEGAAAVQLSGTEGSAAVDAVDAKVAGTAPTTHLVADDFVWTRGYAWYPDTPGQYPDDKWAWYYDQGGLYDQRHELALLPPGAAGPTKEGKAHTFSNVISTVTLCRKYSRALTFENLCRATLRRRHRRSLPTPRLGTCSCAATRLCLAPWMPRQRP